MYIIIVNPDAITEDVEFPDNQKAIATDYVESIIIVLTTFVLSVGIIYFVYKYKKIKY